MRGFSSREHQEMSFGARGTVFGLASTVEAGLVLAGGDLGLVSTRGGGFVLAGRFLAWRAPGDVFWCSRRLSAWLALRRRHRSEKKLFGILALLRGG